MKNLKLLKKSINHIEGNINSVCLTNGLEEGLFCATKDKIILSNEIMQKNVVSELTEEIISIQNGLYIYGATKNTIFSYDNYDGTVFETIEFPLNILTFSLCPDESIILVLTDDLTFTILSNELEILSEFSLEQCGFGTAEPLTVGWGKKETQFHGKLGKESRNIKEEVKQSSEFDSENVFISWKDDGEYFAVSWNCRSNIQTGVNIGARLIRVFTKDGELFSTSEAINTLENGLFWRTKANLIVTSCRSSKGLEIAFIEQNGLRHGGFLLYDSDKCEDKIVSSIEFTANFDICAISICDKKTNETYVQLFNNNNYHWYLKQHIVIETLEPLQIRWSNDKLHLCTFGGCHYIYQWYEEVDKSLILDYDCNNIQEKISPNLVCVIDGKRLLMTPFRHCVVPPPYCAYTIEFDEYLSFVSLPVLTSCDSSDISLFVQFCNGKCQWLKLKRDINDCTIDSISTKIQFGKKEHKYIPVSRVTIEQSEVVNKICWVNNDSFYCIFGNCLYLCNLSNSGDVSIEKLNHSDIIVGNVCSSDNLYIQSTDGSVYTLDDAEPIFLFKFPAFCQEMFTVIFKSETSSTVIGLSKRFNQLFINDNLQSGSYLSALALKSHILFTNVNQKLRCLSLLQNNAKEFIHMLDDKNYATDCDFDETVRLIEPGTEIITCVPGDSKIILMMPRGNLETIFPRALVLDDLKISMEKSLYSECLEKMRRHRVNLNLVYDHNPVNFMNNLEKIVCDNRKTDRLILLLSELSNENVTDTMYKRFYSSSEKLRPVEDNEKVNKICSTVVRLCIDSDTPEDYLFTILTSYVKMTPSGSDKALQHLCAFKNRGETKTWEKGLKYLQYLISIDDLYRVAMSTYDLKLTLQVAQKTQLDPKEYVDFINDLTELPCENYRRYKINMFLKKYSTALECLSPIAENHWSELVELIRENDLYVKSLQFFDVGTKPFNDISSLYAEYLISKLNDLKGAGMVYLRTGDKALCEKAASCFFRTLDWKEWCIATRKSEMSETSISTNLKLIAERLHDIGRHNESMLIYETYLNDYVNALNVSIKATKFSDSFRILSRLSLADGDFVKKIENAIFKSYESLINQLDGTYVSFDDNLKRLHEVRIEFIKKFNEMKNIGEDEILPDYMSDTLSEVSSVRSASSTSSFQSNYSQKSNKSKKKAPKKLWSDKIGSQKEEIGILDKLNSNIKNTQNLTDDIKSFVEILCYTNKIDESRIIIEKMNKLLTKQSMSIDVIWDDFIFDKTFELNEYEYPISNHIKVSRGPKFTGRRRYMIDEEFLRHPPQMKVNKITYAVCNMR